MPSSATILIAEDSLTQALKIRYLLEEKGYRTRAASNGAMALQMMKEERPDILISDIVMPEMDGYELCAAVKRDPVLRSVPVILLTTMAYPEEVIRGLEAEADYFLTKPYDEAYLLAKVAELLEAPPVVTSGEEKIVMNVVYRGKTTVIRTEPRRILSLLLSTFENAVLKNRDLINAQAALQEINQDLENQIAARTASLRQEIAERERAEQEIRKLNEELEQRVRDRTRELEISNAELIKTIDTLRRTQEELVQAEKMASLGNLVAGVAHEINTPVGNAVTSISHLRQKTEEFVKVYQSGQMKRSTLEHQIAITLESAKIIEHNLNRASDLVRSFKQVAVDQSSEARREFQLREYIEEVLLSLKGALKRTRHQVVVECDPSIRLDSFPGALAQILTNLVQNALLHAFGPDDAGLIAIRVDERDGRIRIRFSDNGRGIAPEHLDKIFDPFFTTARSRGGSGLGLHILYNLVTQKLGGTVRCESELGKGTTFIIEFPARAEEKA